MFLCGKCRTSFVVAMFTIIWGLGYGFTGSAHAQSRSVTITEGVGDWVVHESSGRVFASLPSSSEVVEFDSSAQEARRIKVGETPTELIIKRDYLIVACTKSPAIHVIDLKSNEEVGVISVSGKGPYALFCSQVDNHYVYCIANTGSAWWDGEVFQIDIESKQVRNRVKVQPWGQSNAVNVAMSKDGKWIVPDARGESSPSGADLMNVDEEEATFTQVRDYHASFGQIVAGPMNRYWTFGNLLYSLDITEKIRAFAGSPVAIHPQFDLVASITSDGLSLERFSDASLVDAIKISNVVDAEPNASKRNSSRSRLQTQSRFDPTIQFDLKNHSVFVGNRFQGNWVDLQSYDDGLSPLKVVQAPSKVSALVGKPLQIPLQLTNAELPPIAKLRIAEGPASALLEDGKLSWTPQAEDVGFVEFRLEVVSDGEKVMDSALMTVHVTLPKIDLGFHAKSMDISEDGRRLVVWGLAPGQESRHPAHTGPDDIAVIDLKTLTVVARKTLPQGVRCAAIDSKYVYFSPNSGNLFYRVDHQLSGSERQFLQSTPQQLVKIAPDVLAVVGEQTQTFDTEQMKPVPFDVQQNSNRYGNSAVEVVGQKEVQIGPRLFSRQTGKTLRITGPVSLPSLVSNPGATNVGIANRNQSSARWGRQVNGNALLNYKGSQHTVWPSGRSGVISERWPIAVLVAATQQNQVVNTTLEFCDLVDGMVKHSAMINVSPANNSRVNFYGAMNRLLLHDETVLYLSNTELIVATIPQDVAEAMPVPTHFDQEQVTEIELSPTAEVVLRTAGPREGATFSLLAESPGITLDTKSGQVTIALQDLWSEMIKRVAAGRKVTQVPQLNQPSLDFRAENAQRYRELTGKELPDDKFAAHLPIAAVVQDSEGQEDGLQLSVIVVGPSQELDAELKKQEDEAAQRLAQLEAMRRKQREEAAALQREVQMRSEGDRSGKSVNERLDELEARMRRIEAALDAVLKRLEEKRPD